MKKVMALVLSGLLAVSLLAGCTGGNSSTVSTGVAASSESETAEQVTIRVSTWDYGNLDYLKKMDEAFMAEFPNIKVEPIDVPSADYTQKLNVTLNGGSDLDVVRIKDSETSRNLVDKGQLCNLNDLILRDGVDMTAFGDTGEYFKIDENYYAIPSEVNYYVLYYNKDVFDKANIDYPSNDLTWTEFEELAAKLTTGEGSEKVYGSYFHTWQTLVQNWAVQDGEHDVLDTDYSFMLPYYEMVLRMQDAGTCMNYGDLKGGNVHYSGPFQQGTIAMMPMGSWYMSTLISKKAAGETDINWGVATVPHPENVEAGYTIFGSTPIAINAASEKQEAAWEYVKFVTGEKGAKIMAENGLIPGRSTPEALDIIGGLEGMPEGVAEILNVKHVVPSRPLDVHTSEMDQMLLETHGLIMLGEVSVEEGLAQMGSRSKEIQSK